MLLCFRYEIMISCWKFGLEERPEFSKLVKKIDDLKAICHTEQVKHA